MRMFAAVPSFGARMRALYKTSAATARMLVGFNLINRASRLQCTAR